MSYHPENRPAFITVLNPAKGECIASVPNGGSNDAREAVDAAYVYTENLSKAIQVSEQLENGIVGLNDGLPSVAQAPFGGFKQSGLGREGGHHGIDEFLETKFISISL